MTEKIQEKDPWSGILAVIMFGVRATYHTTLEATPSQLVFGRDAILPIQHQADWSYIKNKKQNLIDKNNTRENKSRIPHEYKVGDLILLSRNKRSKLGEREKNGPYPIVHKSITMELSDTTKVDILTSLTLDSVNLIMNKDVAN